MIYYITLYYIISYYSCYILLYYNTLHYIMLYYIILYCIMLYYIILYYIINQEVVSTLPTLASLPTGHILWDITYFHLLYLIIISHHNSIYFTNLHNISLMCHDIPTCLAQDQPISPEFTPDRVPPGSS
jgi:hypothetical protein